ncbi:MAG: DMT family transporter [Ignavibacteriales bacterium]|nr:DMT family transporter [Ignavibacteriales bacterium]
MDWYLLAFISAILSALAAVLQKKILFNFDALEFSFVLSIFNAVLVLAFLPQIDFITLNLVGLIILFGKTILGALAFWYLMLAIKNMEISGALPLMVLTPGFVAIASFIFLGETLYYIEIVGIVLLMIGTYILEVKKGDKLTSPLKVFLYSKYHKYIIWALIFLTLTSVVDKLIIRQFILKPITFVFFQQWFLVINFTIILLIKRKSITAAIKLVNKSSLVWILIISVATIGYRYTQIEAVKIAPVALVLAVKRTSVFFASLIGGKLFAESNLIRKGIAILILLFGAYLLS